MRAGRPADRLPPATVSPDNARQISPDHRALGRAVRGLREAAGLSQQELAGRCGLHRTYVGGIERGERNVSFTNLLRIARALSVAPSRLLADAEALRAEAEGAAAGTADRITGMPPDPSSDPRSRARRPRRR